MSQVTTDYTALLRSLIEAGVGKGSIMDSDPWLRINNGTYTPQDFYNLVSTEGARQAGFRAVGNADGTIRSYTYIGSDYPMQEFTYDDIMQGINSNYQTGTASAKNTFSMQTATNATMNETTGKVETSGGLTKYANGASVGSKVVSTVGSVISAVGAASVGITLGKAIDGFVYHVGDAMGLDPPSSLDPSTWGSITQGDDSGAAGLFNFIFGIDPETEKGTTYMDEDAFSYMALWLQHQGFFNLAQQGSQINEAESGATITAEYVRDHGSVLTLNNNPNTDPLKIYLLCTDASSCGVVYYNEKRRESDQYSRQTIIISNSPNASIYTVAERHNGTLYSFSKISLSNNGSIYYAMGTSATYYQTTLNIYAMHIGDFIGTSANCRNAALSTIGSGQGYINIPTTSGGPQGTSDIPGATQPNTSGWSTPANTKASLQSQYPELWDNRVENDVVQPDGTTKKYIYLPVQLPSGGVGDNPSTTGQTPSTNPQVDPNNSTDTLLETLIKFITQTSGTGMVNPQTDPYSGTNNDNPDAPQNPPDTGGGVTPPLVVPVGSASALWAVYNPTQAEINSLGAWLWSNNFVDQLLKMFNDPMQAIIGLHKTFIQPITGAAQDIKVGYLNSGVSALTIPTQYSTVDCGTVDCKEYFGNVFDYSPYTRVYIYLPFIGFKELDVAQIMRSTIGVVYHGDAFTGTCLAEVSVTRDGGAGGVLYTFSGDCAARYPLSHGSYMGIVNAIAGIGIGIGTALAGAPSIGVAGAVGMAQHARATVEHSGSFSGNSGAMGIKKPYLVIMRPQTAMAKNYEHFTGKPSNSNVVLGSANGYVRVKECHVEDIATATDAEKQMIESALKTGVII